MGSFGLAAIVVFWYRIIDGYGESCGLRELICEKRIDSLLSDIPRGEFVLYFIAVFILATKAVVKRSAHHEHAISPL